jgi:uridine kinase
MPERQEILRTVAAAILRLRTSHVVRVGIDGMDGAGKSIVGDELAQIFADSGRPIIRASVDGFHNPRALRYGLGRQSPEGYFRESYDYEQLKAMLLDPLSPGGSGHYRRAVFDHRSDQPVIVPEAQAAPGDILVFDGIFLHRPELRGYWDYSVFLEVGVAVSMARCAQRDGTSPDPHVPSNRRYVEGQQLYLRECEPWCHATVVINNETLESPWIVHATP